MFKGQRKIGMGAKTKLKDWKASISFSNLFMCQDENKKIKITLHLPGFHIADQLKQRNSTKSILVIDQDGLTLPDRQYYLNAPSRDDDLIDDSNPDSVWGSKLELAIFQK